MHARKGRALSQASSKRRLRRLRLNWCFATSCRRCLSCASLSSRCSLQSPRNVMCRCVCWTGMMHASQIFLALLCCCGNRIRPPHPMPMLASLRKNQAVDTLNSVQRKCLTYLAPRLHGLLQCFSNLARSLQHNQGSRPRPQGVRRDDHLAINLSIQTDALLATLKRSF